MAWIPEIAENLGIEEAIFTPFTAAQSVLNFNLIQNGIIDTDGMGFLQKKRELNWVHWEFLHSSTLVIFLGITKGFIQSLHKVSNCKMVYFNSPHVLELLHSVHSQQRRQGSYGKKTTLAYVGWTMAFGSTTHFNKEHFEEIAMGMELTERPFLWVEFCNRRSQQWVAIYLLALCGRPFLEHEVHITEIWRVGIGFKRNGLVVSRWEIKKKVENMNSFCCRFL